MKRLGRMPRYTNRTSIALALAGLVSLPAIHAAKAADNSDLVTRGQYLATAGDCVACHTAPGGEDLAGGLYLDTPIGKISTPNLTPDKETGLGNWTDEQFYKAMHEGIDDEGKYLYPAFPFPWFTNVTKDDVTAIHAYLKSLKPVHAPRKPLKIGFPFNIREGLLTWRVAFFKEGPFKPDPKASDEVNRGDYLVNGLEHCGACHNRQKLTGASSWSGELQGGKIDGWYAPNITSNGKQGVGKWAKEDIVTFLKTGARPDHTTVALGPMHQVVTESTSHLTDADLGAIAAYLKDVAAKPGYDKDESSADTPKSVTNDQAYLTNCSSCHQRDGKGVAGAIPPLAGNGAVTAAGPENVIRAVLGGLEARNGLAPMPALGQNMSDQDVADAVNYVRSSWGNTAPASAGPGDVAALRNKAQTMLAMNGKQSCVAVKDAAMPNTMLPDAIDKGGVADKLRNMNAADMLTTVDAILPSIKSAAPKATSDQITNALTAAYCPIAMEKVAADRRSDQMGIFATLVYGQARKEPDATAKN